MKFFSRYPKEILALLIWTSLVFFPDLGRAQTPLGPMAELSPTIDILFGRYILVEWEFIETSTLVNGCEEFVLTLERVCYDTGELVDPALLDALFGSGAAGATSLAAGAATALAVGAATVALVIAIPAGVAYAIDGEHGLEELGNCLSTANEGTELFFRSQSCPMRGYHGP